jgi:hypothetical protein
MTTTEIAADSGAGANRTGVYLAVLQLVFTLGWTTYVIYLPKLCAEVGIALTTVILILMLDQAIFTVTDTAIGIAADTGGVLVGRRRRPAGDRGVAGAAKYDDEPDVNSHRRHSGMRRLAQARNPYALSWLWIL